MKRSKSHSAMIGDAGIMPMTEFPASERGAALDLFTVMVAALNRPICLTRFRERPHTLTSY